jgi:hypothetical protein
MRFDTVMRGLRSLQHMQQMQHIVITTFAVTRLRQDMRFDTSPGVESALEFLLRASRTELAAAVEKYGGWLTELLQSHSSLVRARALVRCRLEARWVSLVRGHTHEQPPSHITSHRSTHAH